jgi:hypothetical protein
MRTIGQGTCLIAASQRPTAESERSRRHGASRRHQGQRVRFLEREAPSEFGHLSTRIHVDLSESVWRKLGAYVERHRSKFGDELAHFTRQLPESRALSAIECDLLESILALEADLGDLDWETSDALMNQLKGLHVVGRCSCGCPSIAMELDDLDLTADVEAGILVDKEWRSPEGTDIGIIVRASGGRIAELEAYPRDSRLPFSLPQA